MLRRNGPIYSNHLLISDSDTESDDNRSKHTDSLRLKRHAKGKGIAKECPERKKNKREQLEDEGSNGKVKVLKKDPESTVQEAKRYQEYMEQVPIPESCGADIPFVTWVGLAKSMQEFYKQQLHYSTHLLLTLWDQSMVDGGREEQNKTVGSIMDPKKAEATVWDVEEVHRRCTSYIHLAKLWLCDPRYQAFVDQVKTIRPSKSSSYMR